MIKTSCYVPIRISEGVQVTFCKGLECQLLIPIGQDIEFMPSDSDVNCCGAVVCYSCFNIAESTQEISCEPLQFDDDDEFNNEAAIREFFERGWHVAYMSEKAEPMVHRIRDEVKAAKQ